jgi:uncharacterized protein YjaG (DUF416 family)
MILDSRGALKKLDYNKQLVFAYLLCERLYPNYVCFSARSYFGDKQILRDAIDFICSILLTPNFSNEEKTKSFLSRIDINTPLPHNFDTILASSALDACCAVLVTLNFILDKNTSRLDEISTFATDTVDMYIQERDNLDFNNDPQFDDKIINDPLMKKELDIQNGIVSYLSNINGLESSDITNLLNLQFNEGKSNIGMP